MDILTKLHYLEGTKDSIREVIQSRGVEVPSTTPFRQYANLIAELKGGNEEELEELLAQADKGKLSIILALNNKFGLEISKDATYPQIVEAINLIVVKNLQRSASVYTKLNVSGVTFKQNITTGRLHMIPVKRTLNVTSKLDTSGVTFNFNEGGNN